MFTIGGLSRKGNISTRMLRHYDSIGLLSPAYIGDNGYRYYDEMQLSDLKRIESLKTYGFTLSDIKKLLPLSEDELSVELHKQRLKEYEELHSLKKRIREMEGELSKMKGSNIMNEKYHVIVMESPEQNVFTIRRVINVSETHHLFKELSEEAEKLNLTRVGPTQQMYMGEDFSYDEMDVEAQMVVAEKGDGIRVIPAGKYAAVTHIGPYETVKYAYEAITDWYRNQNEYEFCGPSIERYIRGEGDVNSPEELETGVLFPVKKK